MEEKLNILIVDDEQIVLDSVRLHLRLDNYNLHPVLTTAEAVGKVKNEQIDIVLTDLMMPEMDGLELMAVVKELNPAIPVVMLTGYATINTALQANQIGAFDYIAKPFTKVELKGVVKRAADLVISSRTDGTPSVEIPNNPQKLSKKNRNKPFKIIGKNVWLMMLENGTVRIGVESSFLASFGKIQSVFLPSEGDELRQGSVCFQAFSGDLRTQSLLSPLSGTIKKVNQKVMDEPSKVLQDPYDKGWLLIIKPDKFEEDIKVLGL